MIQATLLAFIQFRRIPKQRFVDLSPLFLGVLCWMLVSCNLKLASESTEIPPTSPSSATEMTIFPEAEITFKVQIPSNSPVGEPILISFLDEITGLALNVRRYEMQAIDEMHYQIELPLPLGTTIKYRYGRQGEYLTEEHSSIQESVRYRLYRVDGPGVVEDVISAWSDTPYTSSSGRIMGIVQNAETGRPVPDLLVSAGGVQALTTSEGSFLIEGLPPGIHNLVVYAMDGAYRTFQQGAQVEENASTYAPIEVVAVPQIPVTFQVQVPPDTVPGIPVRLAGNLRQLGNSFADLTGGMSTLSSHMPILTPGEEGLYQLTINLPAGADLAYKYTLGDGFWNAEHTSSGDFRLRRLIVPETDEIIQDQVDSWGSGFYPGPLIYDLTVEATTPPTDKVSIQFNPFGWTEPIEMWPLGDQRWVYILNNPVPSGNNFAYRYCRNDQCSSADDELTPGAQNPGRVIEIVQGSQTIQDTIESWIWLEKESGIPVKNYEVKPRGLDFIAGVEFQPDYHPSWSSYYAGTLANIQALQANWIVLTPSWTFTHSTPVVLEPLLGRDPTWQDMTDTIIQAKSLGFDVALFPTPHFPDSMSMWWSAAPRDFAWWLEWFERYRSFLLHHADLARINNAKALVLGGDWIQPALPGGTLLDGSPSNVLSDAESRWEGLLIELRDRFKGQIIWAMPADANSLTEYPDFIDSMDKLYLLWSLPLVSESGATPDEILGVAQLYLDNQVLPFKDIIMKPIIVGITYPSAEGSLNGCIDDPATEDGNGCLDFDKLARPQPDIQDVLLDLDEQFMAYEAILQAVNDRNWIDGVVSRGYYPPVELRDKSSSIHGKPVEDLLEYWYLHWVNSPQ